LHRKSRGWTLQKLSRFANVSMRFLSEFERGKETAEIGKAVHVLQLLGLEAFIVPRHEMPASLRRGAGVGQGRGG
jgi:transcriptional regulator with XRE-family HTH domain